MIDEKKLIETIRKYHESLKPRYISKLIDAEIEDIIDIINEQSKIGEWIPVEERLPDNQLFEESYIVQQGSVYYPYTAYWDGRYWTDENDNRLNGIIAWMPLPEKYEGVNEDE